MALPFDQSLIIIPTFNEIDNVEKMIRALFHLYPDISLLIVDDGSPDGTANAVKELNNYFPNLSLMERNGKQGLGTAYREGFNWALKQNFQYIFEMDCDFSHDPEQVSTLLKEALHHDLVIGSRYKNGIRVINWPLRRLVLSYCASLYARVITGIPVRDTTSGFKCFRREALEAIDLAEVDSNGYSFQLEMTYKIWVRGFKIIEVPIIFYERRDGQSKMGKAIVIEAIFSVFSLRLKKLLGTL